MDAQTFYENARGCIVCDAATVGQTGVVNGVTYTAVDEALLESMRSNGDDLSKVCVSLVTDMSVINLQTNFNDDISKWDVSNVVNMDHLFSGLNLFNHDIGNWDVSNVTNMYAMFVKASSFNQDLSGWCVTNIPSIPTWFSVVSGLAPSNHPVWGTCPAAAPPPPAVDMQDPIAASQDITVYLDGTGNASIVPADVDDSSSDNVGITSYSLDVTAFTCSDIGPNTVTLTVEDAAGNSDTEQATVTVADNTAPFFLLLDCRGLASSERTIPCFCCLYI